MDMFTKHLDVDSILDKCLSKGLITANDMSKINATLKGGGTAQAVRDLMLCVKRSAPGYVKTFCGILNDSKSSFLAPYIEELYLILSKAKVKARDISNEGLSIMSDTLYKVNDIYI